MVESDNKTNLRKAGIFPNTSKTSFELRSTSTNSKASTKKKLKKTFSKLLTFANLSDIIY